MAAILWVAVTALMGGLACSPAADGTPGGPSPADGIAPLSAMPDARGAVGPDRLAGELAHLDPALDGWETEQLNAAAGARLVELAALFAKSEAITPAALAAWLDDDFRCSDLRPTLFENVYDVSGLSVSRGLPGDARHDGAQGLARALGELREVFPADAEIHAKSKIIDVRPGADRRFDTKVLVQFWAGGAGEQTQVNATWSITWAWPRSDLPLKLAEIQVLALDEVRAPAPLFSDCTEAVLTDDPRWRAQLLRGTDAWCARIDMAAHMNQYAHNGLSLGDVDGDGLDDLYLCQSGGLPNRLFRHLPDGTVEEVSAAAGVDWLNESRAALIIDLDNDGHQDLAVTTSRGLLIMRGDGTGSFSLAGTLPSRGGYSLSAADLDGDRLLDLYVCIYTQANQAEALPSPYHDANNGPPNVFWRNTGNLTFEDATAATGFDQNNHRFSYASAWADFDEDGDLDLYVANDFGRNNFYINEGGHFRDAAGEAGVEDMAAGMGASWGDYDGDGDLDLYVSNMFSSAGRRISYQRRFQEGVGQDALEGFQRHARGNTLFANLLGQGQAGNFRDVTEEADVWMARWAWGAQFVDLNNDGWEDLFSPNGFITNEDSGDL